MADILWRSVLSSMFRVRAWLGARRLYSNGDLNKNLIDHLVDRGLVSQVTGGGVKTLVESEPTSVYLGADPSAESLHLGNLVPFMVLLHFNLRGHTVLPLVGGATGFVGDPSGRTTERQQMENARREANVTKIHSQMKRFLANGAQVAKKYGYSAQGDVDPVNNKDWWKDITMLGFLSNYGRHIRISQMLARESVKQRLNSEQGIGFSEFTYQVLQAFDFYHLYTHKNCRIQLGGNDQWGNITAGIDLISRLKPEKGSEAYGITVPLLTTPSGEKFGKSAGNAVFIDRSLTRPYHLYQYLLKSPDSQVEGYLKMFTLIPLDEISEIMSQHQQNPEAFYAQHRLAHEVTMLIHDEKTARNSRLLGEIMFENKPKTSEEVLEAFSSQDLLKTMNRSEVVGQPWKNLVATLTNLSKSEAGRLLKQGGVYVGLNRRPVDSLKVQESDIEDDLLLLRVGKTDYHAIQCL